MTTLRVRDFDTQSDRGILEEAERESFSVTFPGMSFPVEALSERLHSLLVQESAALTLEDGMPIGCIVLTVTYLYSIPVGYIENIYIKEEYRAKGGLAMLLNAASSAFASQGIRIMKLDVSSENERALNAYEKFGFVVTQYGMSAHVAP